jgi:hypothetical protein
LSAYRFPSAASPLIGPGLASGIVWDLTPKRGRSVQTSAAKTVLDFQPESEDIPRMVTLKADNRSRVKLPVKPGVVFAVDNHGDGSFTLTVVKAERQEPFPPGSLLKEAEAWNKEFAPLAAKMVVPTPEED